MLHLEYVTQKMTQVLLSSLLSNKCIACALVTCIEFKASISTRQVLIKLQIITVLETIHVNYLAYQILINRLIEKNLTRMDSFSGIEK